MHLRTSNVWVFIVILVIGIALGLGWLYILTSGIAWAVFQIWPDTTMSWRTVQLIAVLGIVVLGTIFGGSRKN